MVKTKNEIIGWESPVVIHPGEFLEEVLFEYNISQAELADRTGLAKKTINEIVKGKSSLTRETAYKLDKVFPISAEYWINLQALCDDDKIRLAETEKIESEISKYLPDFKETYKELSSTCSHFGISGLAWRQKNYSKILIELQRFFGTASLSYIDNECKSVAFRKYKRSSLNQYSISAWIRVGEIKAQNTNVSDFDEKKFKNSIQQLKELSKLKPEVYLQEIERILAECGVVVSYMPQFKNTHIQGASKWVGTKKVLLMLNTHNKDEGRFWFSLFHELGHILNHSKKECFIDIVTFYYYFLIVLRFSLLL